MLDEVNDSVLHDRGVSLVNLQEELKEMGLPVDPSTFAVLLMRLGDIIDKKQYFDADLGEKVRSVFAEALAEIAKQKLPEIKFSPRINMDLAPMVEIGNQLIQQNKSVLDALSQIQLSDKIDDRFQHLLTIVVDIKKTNEVLGEFIKRFDYSEVLQQMVQAVNRPLIKHIDVEKDEWGLKRITPVYKT